MTTTPEEAVLDGLTLTINLGDEKTVNVSVPVWRDVEAVLEAVDSMIAGLKANGYDVAMKTTHKVTTTTEL